jgi:hypothetical protein
LYLQQGNVGVRAIEEFDVKAFPSKVAAFVPTKNSKNIEGNEPWDPKELFDPSQWVPKGLITVSETFLLDQI